MTIRSLACAGAGLIAALAFAGPASAQEPVLSVPIDVVTIGAPNSTHLLAEAPSGTLEGQTCDVAAHGDNNSSVHPGNDLIVQSNGDAVELLDYEREAGAVTEANARLTVGPTLRLLVRLGEDIRPNGLVVSSGGGTVTLSGCTAPPPPPTTPPATTPPAPPTTDIGPPVPPVEQPAPKPPCVDNPETDTNECGLPHTGSTTGPLTAAAAAAIGIGTLAATRRRGRQIA